MNSYLIISGSKKKRLKRAKKLIKDQGLKLKKWENNPDLLILKADPSIGIKQIRQLQKFLSRKPYQAKAKVVIIPQAEKLTIPAQNAFLKTLEEPPANSFLILCSPKKEDFLPTIISRCQLINLGKTIISSNKKDLTASCVFLKTLLRARVGERLELIQPQLKTREKAVGFCKQIIISLRQKLITNKTTATNQQLVFLIKSFQTTLNLLQANVNAKLALNNLVISLPFSLKI